MAIRGTQAITHFLEPVQVVALQVTAGPVARPFPGPVGSGPGIDVATDAVTDPERPDLGVAGFWIDPADLRDAGRRNADVEGRAEREVEPAILIDRDIFPAMRGVGRHVVVHHLAGAEIIEIGFGIFVFDQLVDRDHVERAIPECEAGRHIQALEDGLDLFLAAAVLDRVDVAEPERTHEQRAVVAPGHLPRGQHAGRVDFDVEAGRQLDLLHHRGEFSFGCTSRGTGWWREPLLGLSLVAQEPIIRRMGPEFFGVGLITVKLLLCVGLGAARHHDYCERKNRSIESRFRRVTPSAAIWAASAIIAVLMDVVWSVLRPIGPSNAITFAGSEKRVGAWLRHARTIEKKFLQIVFFETIFTPAANICRKTKQPARAASLCRRHVWSRHVSEMNWDGRRGSNPRPRPWQGSSFETRRFACHGPQKLLVLRRNGF